MLVPCTSKATPCGAGVRPTRATGQVATGGNPQAGEDFQLGLHTGTVNRMSIDPRAALSALTTALEEHLVAASARRGEEDPIVEATFLGIIDAFEAYEEALFDAFDEVTPLVIYGEDGEEDEDFEDEDSEDSDEDGAGEESGALSN